MEGVRSNVEAAAAMGMVTDLRNRWQLESREFLASQGKASDRAATFAALIKASRFVLQSAVLGAGAYLAIQDIITPGVIIAASIITTRAVAPVDQAVAHWRGFIVARQGLQRLRNLLSESSKSTPVTSLPLPHESLDVEGIHVCAPGTRMPILRGIGLNLKKGDGLGIIGPSSAGKSTLGRALVGVWPVTGGAVRLDGLDISQWNPERLGQAIGYVPQDIQLLAGTVAENVARFHPNANSAEIISAAKLANAHDLIARLPCGYDTQIGEGGAVLSGGQRQRIALARALFGKPFMLVLDEPNSNLDAEGEAALTKALLSMRVRGCIVIVIGHRPSTVAAVDTLLFLNDGQVEAYGPKEEVLQRVLATPVHKDTDLKVVTGQ